MHAQLVVTTEGVGLVWKSDPSFVKLTVAVFIVVNKKAIVSGGAILAGFQSFLESAETLGPELELPCPNSRNY